MRIFPILLFFLPVAQAQSQVIFTATSDAKKVETGYMIAVTYSLENAEVRDFTPPKFDGFKLHSGPNRSFSTTIINGKTSQKQMWTFALIALEPGVRTIEPATVVTKSGAIKSNPITITITGASVASGTAKELAAKGATVFVQSKLTDDTVFVGQTVRLEEILYARVPVESYQLLNTPDFKDLFARELRRIDPRSGQKELGKYQYSTRVLKATALTGQKVGRYPLKSNSYQLGILTDDKPQRDPFGRLLGRSFKPETVHSTGTTLTVVPLPEPAREGFCGLVGKYELVAEVDKTQLSTDDAFLISVRITGDGDPKMFRPPVLRVPQGMEAYPAKVVSEEVWEADNQGYFHETVLEYYVVPQAAGKYDLQPEITVFDPEAEAYQVVKANAVSVHVSKGVGPKIAAKALRTERTSPHKRTALIWLAAFGLLGVAIWWFYGRKSKSAASPHWAEEVAAKTASKPIPQPTQNSAPAQEQAQAVASANLIFPNPQSDAPSFYTALEKYLLQELRKGDAYQTKSWLSAHPQPQAATLLRYLDICEQVKYGALRPTLAHEEVWQEVSAALSGLRA